jgi:hypothetical protein
MSMTAAMAVNMLFRLIGPTLRIERRLDMHDLRAKASRHLLDDVIAADAQFLSGDLGWQMAIAKVPSETHQSACVAAAHFGQQLRRGQNLDELPIVQHQSIAAAQPSRFWQIEQKLKAAHALKHHTTAPAVIVTEHDDIVWLLRPMTGGMNGCDAQHDEPQPSD